MCHSLITNLVVNQGRPEELTSGKGHGALGRAHLSPRADSWSLVAGGSKSRFTDVETEGQASSFPSGREILMLAIQWLRQPPPPSEEGYVPGGLSQLGEGVQFPVLDLPSGCALGASNLDWGTSFQNDF